ncbi:MAG: hypothetical protein EAX91_08300 [Candidatus Lokiarchaeota archaeon]|nr:hypothetical protein [Candidatus Lokiarchaeota archaeon]
MKKLILKLILLSLFLLCSSFVFIQPSLGNPLVSSRTYTFDADFDEGTLVNLEHDTVHDQLQLSTEQITLPYIWVPNTGQGTVSKVNTDTGDELGRYWVMPDPQNPDYIGKSSSPSRTTVDLQGNCWVGNRDAGTVVKIGLFEAGIWDDRNGDGICTTSSDDNGNGIIDGTELLPWGEDECVLFEVVLYKGHEGTFAPGDYHGPYDTSHWRTSPRGLAIDAENNLWAGTCPTDYRGYPYSMSCVYHRINGETGAIEVSLDVPGHYAYGAVIDSNGTLWSSNRPTGAGTPHILRLNTTDLTFEKIFLTNSRYMSYGITLDGRDHLFASGWTDNVLSRLDINRKVGSSFPSNIIEWSKPGIFPSVDYYWNMRGVACTSDGDVWVASTTKNKVYRLSNDGVLLKEISLDWLGDGLARDPTGVSVDSNGKVWVVGTGLESIMRIDPNLGSDNLGGVDLEKYIIGSGGQYGYSDMTGYLSRTITTKTGTWTITFDSDESDTPWGTVSWNGEEPEGTSIIVKVRSSDDESTWSAWETVTNGELLSSTPNGRYLQIESTLQILEGDVSPILEDLTVEIGNQPPIADAGPDQTLEQTSHAGTEVYLDGSGSSDPDGDELTYTWNWAGGSTTGMTPAPVIFPLGTTTVTLTVSDGIYTDSDTVDITIIDTTPPEISIIEFNLILWPPNHKYHNITVSDFILDVSDICDADVGLEDVVITSVSSDEPENGRGDGNTLNDIVIVDPQTVKLRAERCGGGNGRVYTINFEVTDASGNTAMGYYKVWVPHHQGIGFIAIDDGLIARYTVYA